ncbi:MAG: hypothetical protein IT308_07440 [Anaerolineaceae bacterium]|nr:hypothetical protein [Anaerolineaceae bacterium]
MGAQLSPVVECYSGYEYAGHPTALCWHDRRLTVTRVEARWRTPYGKAFRVCTEDDLHFELLYQELYGEWQVTPV